MNCRASQSRGYGPEVERKGKKPTGKRKYIYFRKEPKRNDDEEKKKEKLVHMRIRTPHLRLTILRLHLKPFPWYLRRQTPFKVDQAVLNRKLI